MDRRRETDMTRRKFVNASLMVLGATLMRPGFANSANNNEVYMNIAVLTGSPRKNGNSNYLADEFIRGAAEVGHKITRFDAAESNVHPCIACNSCGMDGPCIFQDDFEKAREAVLNAQMAVFATPMYYFGPSAQLKAVIDRFYAINEQIHTPKKAALLMTYANTAKAQAAPIQTHYEVLLDYLGWEDAGRVIAPGVWPAGAIKNTPYPDQAYQLGKSLQAG